MNLSSRDSESNHHNQPFHRTTKLTSYFCCYCLAHRLDDCCLTGARVTCIGSVQIDAQAVVDLSLSVDNSVSDICHLKVK